MLRHSVTATAAPEIDVVGAAVLLPKSLRIYILSASYVGAIPARFKLSPPEDFSEALNDFPLADWRASSPRAELDVYEKCLLAVSYWADSFSVSTLRGTTVVEGHSISSASTTFCSFSFASSSSYSTYVSNPLIAFLRCSFSFKTIYNSPSRASFA